MGLFDNFKTEGVEKDKDVVSSGYNLLPSGVYEGKIKAVFVQKLHTGTLQATVITDLVGHGEYKERIYISNKEGKNYYSSGKEKRFIPGFTIVNDISLLTTNKPIEELEPEPKIFKIYDYDAKEEVPTTVPTFTDMIGQDIALVIRQTQEFKRTQNNKGEWVDTDEVRTFNEIVKAVHPDNLKTVGEITNESDAIYTEAWLKRFKDTVYDKTKGKSPSSSSSSNTSKESSKPSKSLFK